MANFSQLSIGTGQASFESQKRGFGLQTASEAGKRSVRTDDSMTRHDDGQRILAVGGANGASSFG
jgi:hypothetical protein